MKARSVRLAAQVGALSLILALNGCSLFKNKEVERLRAENARLRQALAAQGIPAPPEAIPIDEFIVGLAASEKKFDEAAFFNVFKESLEDAALDTTYSVTRENDERQIAKVRGMLVQQYLHAQKVPIRVSNLTYKLQNPDAVFRIGGTVIPRGKATAERLADGQLRTTFKDSVLAHMDRDAEGEYSIPYSESGGGSGSIQLTLKDVEVFSSDGEPQFARQGDISFNWELSLETVRVYRVNDFAGKPGKFMRNMRYASLGSGLNQFQTFQDIVYLLGFGAYRTGIEQRIRTPSYIDKVEVLSLDDSQFKALERGISEDELQKSLSGAQGWIDCTFVEDEGDTKTWERPLVVQFPFLSRQTSNEKGRVFFNKYGTDGRNELIADQRMRGSGQ